MKTKQTKKKKTTDEIIKEWVENELKYKKPKVYQEIMELREKSKDKNFLIERYKDFADFLRSRGRTEEQIKNNIKRLIEKDGVNIDVEDIFR
ncbi:MAG: hypothetical protein KatS3mg129_3074 [Leptospiraceae bacterium]|nr:MAG: hypothetical protein KatS3mg129_3074 [Leptospiraceae bacterium]